MHTESDRHNAIALYPGGTAQMKPERRHSTRHQFIALADVTEPDSGVFLHLRTTKISAEGCYLEMPNPLPPGRIVKVEITHEGQRVVAESAVVVHSSPRRGMGVKFIALEEGCFALLESWGLEAQEPSGIKTIASGKPPGRGNSVGAKMSTRVSQILIATGEKFGKLVKLRRKGPDR